MRSNKQDPLYNNPYEVSKPEYFDTRGQGPTQDPGYLFAVNKTAQISNIRIILSLIVNVSLVGAIAWYTQHRDITIFYWPIIADLICNLVSLWVVSAFGTQLFSSSQRISSSGTAKSAAGSALGIEVFNFLLKLGLSVVIIWSFYERGLTLGWFGVVLAGILFVLIFVRFYNVIYDSIFNVITLPTLILIFLKVHGIWNISWWWVFIVVRVAAWALIVTFCILALVSLAALVLSIAGKLRLGLVALLVLCILAMMIVIASILLLFALPNYFDPLDNTIPWTGVDLYWACIVYIGVSIFAALVMLAGCFTLQADPSQGAPSEQNYSWATNFIQSMISGTHVFIPQSSQPATGANQRGYEPL